VTAEAPQERIARGVAEAVVVELEAIEVEQNDVEGPWAPTGGEAALEVEHQVAAIAQAGERIGQRFAARLFERAEPLVERHDQSHDDRQQRHRGECDRQEIDVAQCRVDKQTQSHGREADGGGDRAKALTPLARRHRTRRLP
jgi:hypothetical protein